MKSTNDAPAIAPADAEPDPKGDAIAGLDFEPWDREPLFAEQLPSNEQWHELLVTLRLAGGTMTMTKTQASEMCKREPEATVALLKNLAWTQDKLKDMRTILECAEARIIVAGEASERALANGMP